MFLEMEISASIIIPNWNGKDLLPDCFDSLRAQTFKDFETIVVDNHSTDGSLDLIEKNYPEIKVIKLKKNYGFSRAINEGVDAAKSNNIIFLNNDTETDKNWLKNLVKTADGNPGAVSVGSKILNFYKKNLIDGVGIIVNEVGQARSLGYQEEDRGQYDKIKYIFGATGGAALFRKDIFLKVGKFDESFFMYSEEVDFAFRAQFLGFKSVFCPSAIVYHKHKASSKKVPQKIEYWQYRNMFATIIKDFPLKIIFKRWRWLKILMVYANTFFYQIKNGFYWPAFLVQFWLILHLPKLFYQRQGIQKNKKVSDDYIESFLLPKDITFWGARSVKGAAK